MIFFLDSSDKIIPNGVNGGYDDADAEEFADSCEEQNSPGNKEEVNEIDDDDDDNVVNDESNDVDEDDPGTAEVEAIDTKDNDNSNDENESHSAAAQDSERVMGIETVDDEENDDDDDDDDVEMRETFDDNPEDSRGSTRENVDKDIVELSNHSKMSDSMEVLNGPDVSEVSKNVKESKDSKCDEAMDVDAQSNNSDVECLDESITQIDSDNDDVFTIEKPEATNKKRTSGSSDIQQIDESGEIIDSSLDTSDVKICEENGSIGSPDIEEITDSSKSNGHNSEQDGSLKGSPKQKKPRKQVDLSNITPRRSSRNIKRTSYIEKEPEETEAPDDGSDIEEIKMEDPLAGIDIKDKENSKSKSPIKNSKTTIVVSDTKRLVEIAASSKASKGGKKEPTLVIIDTNSILSGRGGVPISSNAKPQSVPSSTSFSVVPMSMAPQSMYPNMRTTITPVPMKSTPTKPATVTPIPSPAQVLPALTDDMFVVEAPSFIVPYVYEKPPINPMKEFLTKLKKGIEEVEKEEKKAADEKREKEKEENPDDSENESEHSKKDDNDDLSPDEKQKTETKPDDRNKVQTYFELPLGKFFMQIGMNLVQEFVQTDLLRTQKRKQGKGTPSAETQMAINSLIKNLEFSKENNEPFHLEMKKCEFCNFKTESTIVMQHHLETPHMKNYVYKCNFCPMEIRSPHDILFHMEAEHNARGRLERGPAFHQCPNCPFEDNQKGKLTRHTIACAKKFRPERNLEPATDWEPPAKIPRLNRARQSMPTSPSALAMAMNAKGQQPLLPKLLPAPMPGRGRGRPPMQPRYTDLKTLRPGASPIRQGGFFFFFWKFFCANCFCNFCSVFFIAEGVAGMMYRPTSSGLLVPTAYQFGSNQIFQVIIDFIFFFHSLFSFFFSFVLSILFGFVFSFEYHFIFIYF